VTCYDDFERALRHPGVDLVSVCTPQHLHCDNVLAAAAAGKHLVIEKPVGNSLTELRRMQEAVRRAKVRTVVSFVLRWNPLFRGVKRLIADGQLGRVYSVETDYLSHINGWWTGWDEARRKDTGVSAMLVAGCHAIDALRWFAAPGEFEAAEPVEVFGYGGGVPCPAGPQYDPLANAWRQQPEREYEGLEILLVRFANGVLGKVSVNFDYIGPYLFPLRVFGDKGTVLDNRFWSHAFPTQTAWIELPTICPTTADVTHHPFQGQMDHFVDCILQGRDSHCNLDDAAKTHEVALAAQTCYRTRQPVRLPLP
jgi:predicted dehydrogenase